MDKIKQVTSDSIHVGLDTVSLESSQELSIKSFAPGPGKLLVIVAPSKTVQGIRPDVPIQSTSSSFTNGPWERLMRPFAGHSDSTLYGSWTCLRLHRNTLSGYT